MGRKVSPLPGAIHVAPKSFDQLTTAPQCTLKLYFAAQMRVTLIGHLPRASRHHQKRAKCELQFVWN